MKVLFFSPYSLNTPHFETDLEIAADHLEEDDEVSALTCRAHLAACDLNPHHDLAICLCCVGRRHAGFSLLGRRVPQVLLPALPPGERRHLSGLLRSVHSLEELKEVKVGDFDLGLAILSSMVSLLREPSPDLERHRELILRFAVAALTAYEGSRTVLRSTRPDRCYCYNGRHSMPRAFFRACQSLGIDCHLHERGGALNKYSLFPNKLPHDLYFIQEKIERMWESSKLSHQEKCRTAVDFFEDQAKGVARGWRSYVSHQSPGLLPPKWDPSKRNIVIFPSSDDEFVAIGDIWKQRIYANQVEGISRLCEDIKDHDDVRLYLRVHPNLSNLDNSQTRAIAKLRSPNLALIPAESAISSYALIQAATCVVTFGSSVGIEAVYWGTPSILLSDSLYSELGGAYRPENHEETIALLLRDLPPKPRERSFKYGYYAASRGRRFRHYTPTDIFKGRFTSKRIRIPFILWATATVFHVPGLSHARRALRRRHLLGLMKDLDG